MPDSGSGIGLVVGALALRLLGRPLVLFTWRSLVLALWGRPCGGLAMKVQGEAHLQAGTHTNEDGKGNSCPEAGLNTLVSGGNVVRKVQSYITYPTSPPPLPCCYLMT